MAGSNLPTTRRFKFEDFPGAPQWFAQFLQALNLFVDPIYQILDGNVGSQNMVAPKTFSKTITSPASGSTTFNFANPLKIMPSAVLIGNIYVNPNPSSHPTNPAVAYWHYSEGRIYIDNITNLSASTTYIVTLIIY
jgi:hypothetical protein